MQGVDGVERDGVKPTFCQKKQAGGTCSEWGSADEEDGADLCALGEAPCQWHGVTAPEGREGRIIRAATDFWRLDAAKSSMQSTSLLHGNFNIMALTSIF